MWGLAFAIGLAPRLQLPAGPDALPGAMQREGLSSSGPMAQFALIIALPFIVSLAGSRVTCLLAGRPWAAWSASIALATAPITLMHFGTLRHVVMHGLTAAAIVALRRLEPRFSRADIVLIPSLLAFYFAFLDIGFGKTPASTFLRAAMALFALRLAAGWLSRSRRPGLAMAAVPLAFVLQMQWLEPSVAGWLALGWMIGTPFVLLRVDDHRVERLAAYVFFPLAAFAYPLALLGALSMPPVDVFEDSHNLLPAAEMARGEAPYRDIIPMHGVVSDGGIDLAVMQTAGPDLGAILTTRRFIGALTLAAIYFVAFGVTTSPHLALLAVFLSLALFPAASVWLRALPPLLALASIAAGTRLRSRKWFAVAGVAVIVAVLISFDLAVFSGAVALVAAIRMRTLRPFLIAAAATALPLLLGFALFGVLDDALYVTLFEILGSGGVYVMGALHPPEGLHTLADFVARIGDASSLSAIVWFAALITSAAALTLSPLRARRADAAWLVGLWIVLAGAQYVVRHHHYFAFALAPFLVGAVLAARRHSRPAAVALTIILALVCKPVSHVFNLASVMRRDGGAAATGAAAEFTGVPRARGALFDPQTVAALESTQRFLTTSLRPNETFLDFASVGLLYFLFDRDCPIRQPEVAMYEKEEAQREVIAAIDANRRVRAVLIKFPSAYSDIDGVHNRDRAPLVWEYIQKHFTPAMDENGVEWWVRQ